MIYKESVLLWRPPLLYIWLFPSVIHNVSRPLGWCFFTHKMIAVTSASPTASGQAAASHADTKQSDEWMAGVLSCNRTSTVCSHSQPAIGLVDGRCADAVSQTVRVYYTTYSIHSIQSIV